jgi:hypothetical protein
MEKFQVTGTLANGVKVHEIVKAENGFHAMQIVIKYKTNGVKISGLSSMKLATVEKLAALRVA